MEQLKKMVPEGNKPHEWSNKIYQHSNTNEVQEQVRLAKQKGLGLERDVIKNTMK